MDFLRKKPALLGLFSPPEVFCGPQICQKCVGGRGSAPNPTRGAHDAPPDFPVGCGGGTPSPIPTPLGAFGASILAPSALSFGGPLCKILATPLLRGNVNNVHVRFIGKRVVGFLLVLIELFFARCYGSRRYGRKYRKSVGGSVSAKFSCKGLDRSFFRFVTMHSDWHF